MKKTVKALVIAASVAAVAGLGAVSFAAWQGASTEPSRDADITIGTVTITDGFVTSGDITLSGSLVPIDQGSVSDGVKMLTGELGNIQLTKGSHTFTLTDNGSSGLKLYYQVSNTTVTAPEITADEDATVIGQLTGWTAIGSATSAISVSGEAEVLEGYKLYIVLVSSDITDMGKTTDLTLTIS